MGRDTGEDKIGDRGRERAGLTKVQGACLLYSSAPPKPTRTFHLPGTPRFSIAIVRMRYFGWNISISGLGNRLKLHVDYRFVRAIVKGSSILPSFMVLI